MGGEVGVDGLEGGFEDGVFDHRGGGVGGVDSVELVAEGLGLWGAICGCDGGLIEGGVEAGAEVGEECFAGGGDVDVAEHAGLEGGDLAEFAGLDGGGGFGGECAVALVACGGGLPCEGGDAGDEREGDGGGGEDGGAVAAGELLDAVCGAGGRGEDDFTAEEAADVGGECAGGFVAALAVFFEGLHDDPVELASEEGGELGGFGVAFGGDAGEGVAVAGDAGAGCGGFDFADDALEFGEGGGAEFTAGEGG